MKLKNYIVISITLLCTLPISAQFTTPIPLPEEVTAGILPNGLHYYIFPNQEPQNRVSFYFVQNVGAILENDHQNGLAHFLEHMAFNGTEHFKGKGIINMLEKNGVSFGKEINAYTALDETVYNLSNVPATNEKLLDSCLYVLHDWSGYLSLTDEEIDAERGVIKEEWRTRHTAEARLKAKTDSVLYHNSKYAKRDIIGDLDIITNFDYDDLRSYYHQWYRPDLQAVIIVGDIDPNSMEKKINTIFSDIPVSKNTPKRTYEVIPNHKELYVGIATDKEATRNELLLRYVKPVPTIKDTLSIQKEILGWFYTTILNKRLKKHTVKRDSPALQLVTYFSPISRLNTTFNLSVIGKKGQYLEAFNEGYREIERLRQLGITPTELAQTKKEFLKIYTNYLANKDKIDNESWAGKLVDHFLTAKPFLMPQQSFDLIVPLTTKISIADINSYAKELIKDDNRVILATGSTEAIHDFPSKAALLSSITEIENEKLNALEEHLEESPLITQALDPVAVTKEISIDGIPNAKGYILANGAQVVLLPTSFLTDQVTVEVFSKGGQASLALEDLPSGNIATILARLSGIGNVNKTALQEKLTGKTVSIQPYIAAHTEGLEGHATKADFETLLQLLYLSFEEPRFDPEMFAYIKEQYEHRITYQSNDHASAFKDSIQQLNTNNSKRNLLFTPTFIKKLNFEKARDVYKDRFQNAADFTFVFVGSLPENTLSLLQKYIGNIASNERFERTYRNHHIQPKKGTSTVSFSRPMENEKTSVYIHLTKREQYTPVKAAKIQMMGELLSKRYLATIREEEGGSYGVNVQGTMNMVPEGRYNLSIIFDCAPNKQEKLIHIVWEELANLVKYSPSAESLEDIKKAMIKTREEQLESNSFWASVIYDQLLNGNPYISLADYKKMINNITINDIQQTAKKIVKSSRQVQVIMAPAN